MLTPMAASIDVRWQPDHPCGRRGLRTLLPRWQENRSPSLLVIVRVRPIEQVKKVFDRIIMAWCQRSALTDYCGWILALPS
jgi:hypothetical protein